MEKLCFVTGNPMKFSEARKILSGFGIEVEQKELDIDEIQDRDAERVSRLKAKIAYGLLKRPLFVEDTGLYIKSMNGYPGTLIKHFLGSIGTEGIVQYLNGKDRSAEAVMVLSYCDAKGKLHTFEGRARGRISEHVAKGYEFAWDRIFIPEGTDKTFSELGESEKNRISQRRKALEKFAAWLKK
jgi:XTP/dITP diphosphohydrolase